MVCTWISQHPPDRNLCQSLWKRSPVGPKQESSALLTRRWPSTGQGQPQNLRGRKYSRCNKGELPASLLQSTHHLEKPIKALITLQLLISHSSGWQRRPVQCYLAGSVLQTGRDEPATAPEESASGLPGFVEGCSLIPHSTSAIGFSTPLQSSPRKLA